METPQPPKFTFQQVWKGIPGTPLPWPSGGGPAGTAGARALPHKVKMQLLDQALLRDIASCPPGLLKAAGRGTQHA
ncbi:unnamed protein product [Rangifer tarandus platyrhynchus]|uniref:Uncharacterized protein n=1 Tax=Rangifer tarandus platyrhynchus TaxID=3082113 RepID=A0AC60A8H9_RANTA